MFLRASVQCLEQFSKACVRKRGGIGRSVLTDLPTERQHQFPRFDGIEVEVLAQPHIVRNGRFWVPRATGNPTRGKGEERVLVCRHDCVILYDVPSSRG